MYYYFSFLAIFSLFLPSQVFATTIEPVAHTVSINPGEETTVELSIKNTEDTEITVTSYVLGLENNERTGLPLYVSESPLIGWIATPEEISLVPGESNIQTFRIQVPSTQTPGTYRGVLVSKVSGESGQISTEAELGSLITVYVAGDITESLSIRHIDISPHALRDNKRTLLFEFENEGNIHVDLEGEVRVVDRNSHVIDVVPLPMNTVFSQMRRKGQIDIEIPASYVGPIDVQLHATYGLTQKQVGATIRTWYIAPYAWWILYSILGVSGVGIISLLFRRKRVV